MLVRHWEIVFQLKVVAYPSLSVKGTVEMGHEMNPDAIVRIDLRNLSTLVYAREFRFSCMLTELEKACMLPLATREKRIIPIKTALLRSFSSLSDFCEPHRDEYTIYVEKIRIAKVISFFVVLMGSDSIHLFSLYLTMEKVVSSSTGTVN